MNDIDLQILIPASPEFIWRFLGDLAVIPQWHEDVVSVSFLSTQREGRGTRWRHSTLKGNDVVVEISAWYDTLGYEYRLVDGSNFAQNQGRIRLQEVAEGTLVRWTFQYEIGGVLGGLRNAVRLNRSTTNQIQESLRNLHQLIAQESGGISTHEAKASMKEAPDVDERIGYRPRHQSAFVETRTDEFASDDDTSLAERLPLAYDLEYESEPIPVIADTDTKPNPVVLGSTDDEIIESQAETDLEDTKPAVVETLLAEQAPPEPESLLPEPEPLVSEHFPEQRIEQPPAPSLISETRQESRETAHLSVFEIFGLQKPSEAKAQVEESGEIFRERYGDEPVGEDSVAGTGYKSAIDTTATRDSINEPPLPEAISAGDNRIAGWRRRSRRRSKLLRSHT